MNHESAAGLRGGWQRLPAGGRRLTGWLRGGRRCRTTETAGKPKAINDLDMRQY